MKKIVTCMILGYCTALLALAVDKEVTTFPLSENLIIAAETISPAMDERSGDLIGLSASGQVSIKVRPKGTQKWIYVTCGELVYDVNKDEIVLKGHPVVKSGIQVLRATSDKTYVRVSRKTGKWVIKGPHKIELKFK
ncbi:MAG: LptA/OstA family protein [Verrucomicrobiales bacterium]|nr:LptA/OstA family protein [Verrucomicrobiales bacterium]